MDSTARESLAELTSSSSADENLGGFNWANLWALHLPDYHRKGNSSAEVWK